VFALVYCQNNEERKFNETGTSQGVQVPPFKQATLSQPVRATEQFLPPKPE
jgi:hypothetical protein